MLSAIRYYLRSGLANAIDITTRRQEANFFINHLMIK